MRVYWVGLLVVLIAAACADSGDASNQQIVAFPTPIAVPTSTPTPDAVEPAPSTTSVSPTSEPVTPVASSPTSAPSATLAETPVLLEPKPLKELDVEVAFPEVSFKRMVAMAYPEDDSNRLFVVLQPGQIVVFPNEQDAEASTFLDIRRRVSDRGNEEGLLSVEFDRNLRNLGCSRLYAESNPAMSKDSAHCAVGRRRCHRRQG